MSLDNSNPTPRDRSCFQLLATQGVVFPSLRTLKYSRICEDDADNSSLSIFLQALGPTVRRIYFLASANLPDLDAQFELAIRRIVDVCQGLKSLEVDFVLDNLDSRERPKYTGRNPRETSQIHGKS